MGKEEREILQGVMDNVHEQFMKAVSEGRKIRMEEVRKIADGRVFTGEQAKTHGLVDELGTIEDAIKTAGTLAGIEGEPEVVSKTERLSIIDILRNKFPKEMSDIFPTVKIKYLFSP
jgi:protease-4